MTIKLVTEPEQDSVRVIATPKTHSLARRRATSGGVSSRWIRATRSMSRGQAVSFDSCSPHGAHILNRRRTDQETGKG